jgi:uncharacterized membrane protein YbhN (UPF0104 family)
VAEQPATTSPSAPDTVDERLAARDRFGLRATVRFISANRYVRAAFVLAAVGLGVWAVASRWGDVRAGLSELGWLTILASLLAVLAGLAATLQIWRVLLSATGSPLPVGLAARIFFIGQLGKYLPGSMWPVLVQMELAQAAKVPRSRTATAAVLTLVASVCAGLLAALVSLPFLPTTGTRDYRWALLAIPVLLAALHPAVVNAVVARLLTLTGRAPLPRPLSAGAVLAAMGWALLSWGLLGVHVWLLAIRLGASPGRGLLLLVGGFAFAWAVGFLVVVAPAGAGVRDLLLAAILAGVLTTGAATVVALVSRVLMTVGDLILAGLAAWFARRYVLAPEPAAPERAAPEPATSEPASQESASQESASPEPATQKPAAQERAAGESGES